MSYTYARRHTQHASTPETSEVRGDPREDLKEQVVKSTHMWRGRAHKEDPMSAIDEVFQDEYSAADQLGDRKILGMMRSGPGLVGTQGKPVEEDQIFSIGKDTDKDAQDKRRRNQSIANEVMERSDMSSSFVPEDKSTQLRKFEEIGLRRGKLSASVLKGTSQMMLFSCLKRTFRVGDGEPEHEHKIFESKGKPFKGPKDSSRDFNTSLNYTRDYPRSAIALTIQANRSALDTVGQLRDLVDRGKEGSFTLWKSMPFLSSKNEERVLKRYKKCVKALEGMPGAEHECDALERAITYIEAVAKRKENARVAFAHKLKDVARQAEIAAMVFSDNGLLKAMEEGLRQSGFQAAAEGEPPPDDENPFKNGAGNEGGETTTNQPLDEASAEQTAEDPVVVEDSSSI